MEFILQTKYIDIDSLTINKKTKERKADIKLTFKCGKNSFIYNVHDKLENWDQTEKYDMAPPKPNFNKEIKGGYIMETRTLGKSGKTTKEGEHTIKMIFVKNNNKITYNTVALLSDWDQSKPYIIDPPFSIPEKFTKHEITEYIPEKSE